MNEEIHYLNNKRKVAKNEWETDGSEFYQALCCVYKELGQFFSHAYSLT